MAMLTDDEYKDFEAQIKLQEKVLTSNFLEFTAVHTVPHTFTVVHGVKLVMTSGKARIRRAE